MKKLIEKIKSGNVHAFQKLYIAKKDDGFRICLALCKNYDDAKDACQKGFINVFHKLSTLREVEYFESWFYRIMMNASYDVIRTGKYRELNIEEESEKVQETDKFFHTRLLLQALEELPNGYRTVFIMHFFQEMKHSEIAEILQCSAETSRSQYARAKMKIKEVLSQKMELSFDEI